MINVLLILYMMRKQANLQILLNYNLQQIVSYMKNAFKIINEADKSIILSPEKPLYSLIWLHGLGDSSQGFLDYFQAPSSPVYHGFRIRLLHAPIKPVTINGGMKCPSWYDIKVLSFEGSTEDEDKRCNLEQVKASLQILDKKVQEQAQFLKTQKLEGDVYKRIFVGGFSQGCAVSLLYGLTCKHLIGGVVGFSGYLFQSFPIPNLGKTPILLNHGIYDSMIPYQPAKKSYKKILQTPTITLKQKKIDHSVDMNQLQEMGKWLSEKTKASSL